MKIFFTRKVFLKAEEGPVPFTVEDLVALDLSPTDIPRKGDGVIVSVNAQHTVYSFVDQVSWDYTNPSAPKVTVQLV